MPSFGTQVILGLIVGVIVGLVARHYGSDSWLSNLLTGVGSAYVTLLKLLIPPLVITAVVTSISNLREQKDAARLAARTIGWFMTTAFFSVLAGIAVGVILKPGIGSGVSASAAKAPSEVGSWSAFISEIIPSNIFGLSVYSSSNGHGGVSSYVDFNVLQLLVISIAVGVAAVQLGKKAQPLLDVTESLLAVVQKALWWIIRLAPIGTAALIGKAVAKYGWDAIGSLGKFVLAIHIGLVIVLGVIYPLVLKANRLPIGAFYRKVWPATSMGFVSRSSMGTMPLTERVAEFSFGVPRSYAAFAVPLGATTKMDGCAAVYPAVAAIFVSQFYGVPLSPVDYLLIVAVSVFGSAATAGTTGSTVMLTLTLSTLGLPLDGVGLLLAVEPIIDMSRTAVNVTGQALIPVIVAKQEKLLDLVAFNDVTRKISMSSSATNTTEADHDAVAQRQDPEPVPAA